MDKNEEVEVEAEVVEEEIEIEYIEEDEIAIESIESDEVIVEEADEIPIMIEDEEPLPIEEESPIDVTVEVSEESDSIEVEFEEKPEIDEEESLIEEEIVIDEAEESEIDIEETFELVTTSSDISEDEEEPVVYFVEDSESEEMDDKTLAKDLISEKLEADEILSEELDRVSEEEIDVALEALSSDEVVAIDESEERPAEEVDDSVKEFAEILGTLESYETEPEPEVEDDEEMDFSDYLAEELDDILGKIQKVGRTSTEDEE